METVYEREISAHVMIKAAKETPEGDWIVSGPIASLEEDYDGETLTKAGILSGLKMFERLGSHVDYEHRYKQTSNPDWLIGKGIAITEENGVPYLTTKLFKGKAIAKALWEHLQNGGEAGYSIEGYARKREGKKVLETEIHRITISPFAKGFDAARKLRTGPAQSVMALSKALILETETKQMARYKIGTLIQKALKAEEDGHKINGFTADFVQKANRRTLTKEEIEIVAQSLKKAIPGVELE